MGIVGRAGAVPLFGVEGAINEDGLVRAAVGRRGGVGALPGDVTTVVE